MSLQWYNSVDRRLANVVSRGNLTTPVDEGDVQNADLTAYPGNNLGSVPRVQNYGFTSLPSAEAEVVFLCEGGSQELPIIISADHPAMRPKIEEWETCVWTKFQTHVWLKSDKSLDVKADKFIMTLDQDYSVTTSAVIYQSPKFGVKSPSGSELLAVIHQTLLDLQTDLASIASGTPGPMPGAALGAVATRLTANLLKLQPFIVS